MSKKFKSIERKKVWLSRRKITNHCNSTPIIIKLLELGGRKDSGSSEKPLVVYKKLGKDASIEFFGQGGLNDN
jgi:hypothetical protein